MPRKDFRREELRVLLQRLPELFDGRFVLPLEMVDQAEIAARFGQIGG